MLKVWSKNSKFLMGRFADWRTSLLKRIDAAPISFIFCDLDWLIPRVSIDDVKKIDVMVNIIEKITKEIKTSINVNPFN